MRFLPILFLFQSFSVQAYDFDGLWNVDKVECKHNDTNVPCKSTYSKIEVSFGVLPDTLILKWAFMNQGYKKERLTSFDFSKPEHGLTYKAELSLLSNNAGVAYLLTDADGSERAARGVLLYKVGDNLYTLTETFHYRNYSTGDSNQDDTIYFLSR